VDENPYLPTGGLVDVRTVNLLSEDESDDISTPLRFWSLLLYILNPTVFQISVGLNNPSPTTPTITEMPSRFVNYFTRNWDRLEEVASTGPRSILLLPLWDDRFTFGEVLKRCRQRMGNGKVLYYRFETEIEGLLDPLVEWVSKVEVGNLWSRHLDAQVDPAVVEGKVISRRFFIRG